MRLGSNGGMFGSEWEAAVCASGLQFGRVGTCVDDALFDCTLRLKVHHAISAMD